MRAAWVLGTVLVAACGGADDPTPPAPVVVEVRDRLDRPVTTATVFAHDPSGDLVDEVVTGADGRAAFGLDAGSAITVRAAPVGSTTAFRTVLAVEPGDVLRVEVPAVGDHDPGWTPERQVALTLPPLPADTIRVRVASPCAFVDGAGTELSLGVRCSGPTTLVATALDAQNRAIAYLVAVADLGRAATLTVQDPWEPAAERWTLLARNLPAGLPYVQAQRFLGPDVPAHGDLANLTSLPAGGVGAVEASRPLVDERPRYHAVVGPWTGAYRHTLDTDLEPDDRVVVDFAALPVHPLVAIEGDGQVMRWSGGDDADLVEVTNLVAEGQGDVIGRGAHWRLWAPPGTRAVRFPTDVGFPFPGTTEPPTRLVVAGVQVRATSWWSSYDVARQDPLAARPARDFRDATSWDGVTIFPTQ